MSTLEKSCENICEFVFFRLWTIFLLFGGVCAKCSFYKEEFFLQEDFFETNLDLRKHPQQVFWIFSLFFKHMCSIFVFICVFGELRELCAKILNFWTNIHREIICQSWPLLTPFYSGPIVQWMQKFACQKLFFASLTTHTLITQFCCQSVRVFPIWKLRYEKEETFLFSSFQTLWLIAGFSQSEIW